MAKLIFTNAALSGRVYELVLEKTTVGRGDQNTLVIRDSSLSLTHCEILMNGSEIILRDLNSSNGTFVNSSRLNGQAQVKSGQTVRFGAVEARLELDPRNERTNDTEITAIYTLDRIMREKSQAQSAPSGEEAPMQLESGLPPSQGEHTTVLVKADLPQSTAPTVLKKSEQPADVPCKFKYALITALAVLGLIALAWLVWGRK